MQTQRFAVEFERRTVGIAVRVPGGFVFYSSDEDFMVMDGRIFPRARMIERQLKKLSKQHNRTGPLSYGKGPVRRAREAVQ